MDDEEVKTVRKSVVNSSLHQVFQNNSMLGHQVNSLQGPPKNVINIPSAKSL
jgi:hypothetical protein